MQSNINPYKYYRRLTYHRLSDWSFTYRKRYNGGLLSSPILSIVATRKSAIGLWVIKQQSHICNDFTYQLIIIKCVVLFVNNITNLAFPEEPSSVPFKVEYQ